MPTVGVRTDITLSGDTTRINVLNFYKSFSQESNRTYLPVSIPAESSKEIDLSESTFVVILASTESLNSEVLNATFTSSTESFTLSDVGFIMLNFSNLLSVTLTNTSQSPVEVNIIL